jgi:glycyl-tRNA synthetase
MESLYAKNGLVFWNNEEIKARNMIAGYLVEVIGQNLQAQNPAWRFYQVEAPILTPYNMIDSQYTDDDIYRVDEALALRPETTMGSYQVAKFLLSNHSGTKLPFCVWQLGKSFRKEQDQPLTKMRLKEFYQMEFQCLYSPTTAKDYAPELIQAVCQGIEVFLGPCTVVDSDRLPKYAEYTKDIVWAIYDREDCKPFEGMELASCSKRKDYEKVCNIEIAIGMDRLVRCFMLKNRREKNSEISS